MNWIVNLFTSSLGKKVIMSLSGLFLCLFLVIHMAGNMQLLAGDAGLTFNKYAYDMTHNPLIKVVSYVTYFLILLHAFQGILLAWGNRGSRKSRYASKKASGTSVASRNMAILGTLILVFIVIHMKSFWYEMHWGDLPVDANGNKDLFTIVKAAFTQVWYVAFYLVALLALAFHLFHGFQSAFQTLGINHSKYSPIIKVVGYGFAIIIPLLFAIQPLYFLLN